VDKKTARAVATYQRKQGLPATGVVTAEVWDSLT
jgi:peptidoglycan hydrolase-like protein with peptidoglycan-binding domain